MKPSDIFRSGGQASSTVFNKPARPTKANLIREIEKKPKTSFTAKIEIKNLELSRRLAQDVKGDNRAGHGTER